MAGQPKQGLDFAACDVHICDDDERFDVLIDAQGWSGFGVFFYICTKAYATNGYYYCLLYTSIKKSISNTA